MHRNPIVNYVFYGPLRQTIWRFRIVAKLLMGFVLYFLMASQQQKQGAGRATILITVTEKKKTKTRTQKLHNACTGSASQSHCFKLASVIDSESDAGPPSSMSCRRCPAMSLTSLFECCTFPTIHVQLPYGPSSSWTFKCVANLGTQLTQSTHLQGMRQHFP